MEPEFLSIKEAAIIFSINEVTLRRAIRKGLIIAIKIGDGKKSSYRISRKSIDEIHKIILFQHSQISIKNLENKN